MKKKEDWRAFHFYKYKSVGLWWLPCDWCKYAYLPLPFDYFIKVPILQVALLFQMQLWPVAHFFSLNSGWVQQQSNSKPTQKWVKKVGNWSELHWKKQYYF